MQPQIISAESLLLVGMSFYGDPFGRASGWNEDNEIGKLWKRFTQFTHKYPESIRHRKYSDAFVEVHFITEESAEKGYFEIFTGVIVERLEEIPLECVAKTLPQTQYAIFTLHGEEITSDWGANVLNTWFQTSGYAEAYPYHIQFYDHRFKGMDAILDSTLDIYIPVKAVK